MLACFGGQVVFNPFDLLDLGGDLYPEIGRKVKMFLNNTPPGFFNAFKLWSLLEMLKVEAVDFIAIGQLFQDFSSLFPLSEHQHAELTNFLRAVKSHCEKLNLKVSINLLENAEDFPPHTKRELDIYQKAIESELASHLFFHVPTERATFHESNFNLEEPIIKNFPNSSKEILRACNCYAFGEFTASVFHSMRAAEVGLRALADKLGVTLPFPLELADWQDLINKIDSAIRDMNKLPKTAQKDEDLKFYSSAVSQCFFFKEAYRKHVAHARETYDQRQALKIASDTLEFLAILAAKLSE